MKPKRSASSPHLRRIGTAAAGVFLLGVAHAQTPATPPATATSSTAARQEAVLMDEVVVSGIRGSLVSAQELKQESVQFVDSIVAEDIGKLPDNSVADALQRIPGVQVGRGGSEVGPILIRGLPNLGTTLNGNEIFTGTARGVALLDIPAELVAGVDVYKSTSPEKVEGGIAGLIDIRLRKPLDFAGRRGAGSARFSYGEDSDKTGYVGSILLSDRWKTGTGEIGVLYSGAYQQRYLMDQTAFNFLFEPVDVPATLVPGQTRLMLPFTQGSLIVPADRQRHANNLSVQWRINEEWEIYNDFLHTAYRNENQVYFNIGFPRFGAFTAATVIPGTNVPLTTTSTNNFHLTSMQAFKNRTDGYHNVLGIKRTAGATTFSAEYLYNWNGVKNQALIVDTRFAPTTPGTFTFSYNDAGRANQAVTGANLADGNQYLLWGLFDNRDHSASEQHGWKADVTHRLATGFFQSISGGLRWTNREVRSRATQRNDVAPAGAVNGDRFHPNVPRTSTIPGFTTVSPEGPLSYYDAMPFVTASPSFLYANPDQVRSLFGLPAGPANWAPTLGFTDEERVVSGYVNAAYASTLGGKPLSGTIGVRVARTTQELQGYRTNGTAIDDEQSQTDILPVLNAKLRLDERLQLRFAAGRTITRPDFDDLNPAATLNAPTTTGGAAGTGNGGNPDLDTVRSDNYDLALEYYFAPGSYFSISAYDREIKGYVQSFAAEETIAGTRYIIVRPRNAGEGRLYGFEAAYQHFPDFSQDFLKGFGWQINYTYIDGENEADDPTSTANPPRRTTLPYAQVSQHAYNVVGIYERGKFSARLAYNWRDEYVDTFNGPNSPTSGLRTITVEDSDQLDFSASYRFSENLTVSLDATNILGREHRDYFADPTRFRRDTRAFDRTIGMGVRFQF